MTRRKDSPSAEIRIRVMKRDRFQCTYCGSPGTDSELEIDHIIPVAKGGSHHISNLTTACRGCNQKKGAGVLKPTKRAQAKAPDASPSGTLVGLFVHTFTDGQLRYQGRVIGLDGDMVLVQLFSWIDGYPTNVEGFKREFIYSKDCALYASNEEMIAAYETYARARGEWYDDET